MNQSENNSVTLIISKSGETSTIYSAEPSTSNHIVVSDFTEESASLLIDEFGSETESDIIILSVTTKTNFSSHIILISP